MLKDACKRLKNVDFSKPASRVPEICKALLELNVINRPPEPKIVRLEGWEERELFSDGLDEGF